MALNVFSDHIKFKIHGAVYFDVFHVCMFRRKWNDSDGEFILSYIEAGETDSVDTDGALFDDQR